MDSPRTRTRYPFPQTKPPEKRLPWRPRKFDSPEALQEAVDNYFDSCFETKYIPGVDEEGNKYLEEKRVQVEPFTITGLALALDMSRDNLLYYTEERDPDFYRIISRAKLRCQNYAERQAMHPHSKNITGPIFNLKANYGWVETNRQEVTGKDGAPLNMNVTHNDERARQTRARLLAELEGE